MNFQNIIEKKKQKQPLSYDEYLWFVKAVINEEIPNYQASALLMAIYFNSMNDDELYSFTKALIDTSTIVEVTPTNTLKISLDKHSSGGVGDKVSLILSPILVALGYDVVKISGHGLEFTGGTLDKLDSIATNYSYNKNNFQTLLDKTHMMIMMQNEEMVPGDKKLYALRDVTGTVDSLPLIAASIMSKKLILKNDYIFLDIKVGDGAFFKNLSSAKKFAKIVLKLSHQFNRKTIIHITNMSQPLGNAIGNGIEIQESVNFLKNKCTSSNLKDLIFTFVSDILLDTKICKTKKEAINKINMVLENNSAYKVFVNFVKTFSSDYTLFQKKTYFKPKYKIDILAEQDGYLSFKSTKNIGLIACYLGAGRFVKEDVIDYHAGIQTYFDPFQYVTKGQKIATLYASKPIEQKYVDDFKNNLLIANKQCKQPKIVLKKIK